MKPQNQFLTIIFVIILTLPSLDTIFHFSPVKELFEKRLPAARPEFPHNLERLKNYPKNFEKFFDDNYGLRKTLVLANSKMMDNIFDQPSDSRVVIGQKGWMYFDNYNSILDAIGKAGLDDELIQRGVKSFGRNWQKLHSKNIGYLLVIAADKSSIYPEFLPSYLAPTAGINHRIDKFLNALKKEYPDFPVLDLRPILLEAKEKEIIYHQTDTHWNKRGAHYGYVAIMKALANQSNDPSWTKNLQPHLRPDFIEKADEFLRGDISDIINSSAKNLNYDLLPRFKRNAHYTSVSKKDRERFYKPVFFAKDEKNLPRIFAYQDSFFADLFWFVSDHFSRSFYVNEFPCDLKEEIVEEFRPNFLIQEFWEGRIEVILRECGNR